MSRAGEVETAAGAADVVGGSDTPATGTGPAGRAGSWRDRVAAADWVQVRDAEHSARRRLPFSRPGARCAAAPAPRSST